MTNMNEKIWNIQECTDKGVHEAVLGDFYEYKAKSDSKILVLGSGFGALEEKLVSAGYRNIVSVDIDDKHQIEDADFIQFDLNNDFYDLFNVKFDYVFIVEVIEHIENSFHFFKNVKEIINKTSIVYVTTPNVHRKSLRLKYFLTGEFDYFREKDIHESGHILPIFDHILQHVLYASGLMMLSLSYNRNFVANSLIGKVKELIYKVFTYYIHGNEGIISIYKIKLRQ